MNGLSYRTLLYKEEMEDSEIDTIPMNDIVVYKIDKSIKRNTGAKFLKAKLIQAKKQAMWSCKILFSLLRYVHSYVKMKQNFTKLVTLYISWFVTGTERHVELYCYKVYMHLVLLDLKSVSHSGLPPVDL